ncbi:MULTISPECIES: inositol-3-phosphate synthase [Halorussus]|uniref:inositol-3-phosphate synthase n=1 Tax=Halorussus TaxID=1070314 RepID=UPI0020A051FD|nr:inositol-3-phosphate synthase [Halorussus vallis]USZ77301.1 inositol-3-phosphate synthase [Halorussus vallis]
MSGTGVWFVGARGNIATTAMVGALAVARGEIDRTGMVTANEPYADLDMPAVSEFVFGGHDVRDGNVLETAREIADRNGTPAESVVETVAADLREIEDRIERGTARNCGERVESLADGDPLGDLSAAETVEQFREDLRAFEREAELDRVIVVNVASTEPSVADPGKYDTREAFERAVEDDDSDLPASSLYAYAALSEGYPYANFTPSAGSSLGGIRELAREEGVPHMGDDGKTGESLVKATLAPMFAGRNLRVLSWEGHNILGNTDGQVLEDDRNKQGKLDSKGAILDEILPDIGHNRVRIDYTPSLDDWKTAWDYVHFEGFLDTQMKMQFTWEGSDSALAAPLVLDIARLLDHADRNGEAGLQTHLASFFKDPQGVEVHDLSRQFELLDGYAKRHREGEGDGREKPEPAAEPTD